MYPEILNKNQSELLPLLQKFKREYFLVGGTAIALQIGHRQSIDFDFFKFSKINSKKIYELIKKSNFTYKILWNSTEQINIIVNEVNLTFLQYPFKIEASKNFKHLLRMPDLLSLAAMKAYALGRRSKWKDYVDIYLIIKDYYTIDQICEKAESIFGELFSAKMFRLQLCYFDDIDYREPLHFVKEPINDEIIRNFLIEKATLL